LLEKGLLNGISPEGSVRGGGEDSKEKSDESATNKGDSAMSFTPRAHANGNCSERDIMKNHAGKKREKREKKERKESQKR